jgi:hypothetical protein
LGALFAECFPQRAFHELRNTMQIRNSDDFDRLPIALVELADPRFDLGSAPAVSDHNDEWPLKGLAVAMEMIKLIIQGDRGHALPTDGRQRQACGQQNKKTCPKQPARNQAVGFDDGTGGCSAHALDYGRVRRVDCMRKRKRRQDQAPKLSVEFPVMR